MQTSFKIKKSFYYKVAIITFTIVAASTVTMILLGSPKTNARSAVYITLCILSAPSLFGLIYVLNILFSNKPPLILDPGGLYDDCNGSHSGSIRWHNVHDIQGYQRGKYKYLMLGITDIRPLLEQRDIGNRMAFEKKLERDKHHVSIMLNQLQGDPDEIFETIKQQWKAATGRRDE